MGLNLLAWAALAYIVGAVPTDSIVARLLGRPLTPAPTRVNVLSFLVEVIKGAALVWLAAQYAWSDYGMTAAGVAVVLGSNFSFRESAREGTGLGTVVGALAVAAPVALLAGIAIWALVFLLARRPNTATLVAASVTPLAAALSHYSPAAVLLALGVCLVILIQPSAGTT